MAEEREVATFAILDGGEAAAALEAAFEKISDDSADRVGIPEKRSLTVTVTVEPFAGENVSQAQIKWKVVEKVPPFGSGSQNAEISEDGKLLIDPTRATALDQGELPEGVAQPKFGAGNE